MDDRVYNLLLIEDNPGDAKLIQHFLHEAAHNTRFAVKTVDRLAAGLDIIADQPVDVVLLDLHLPDSMGIETAERLLQAVPELPVVVLTSVDDDNLGMLMDIDMRVTVELGRTRMRIRDIMELSPGSIVELGKPPSEPVDIMVNGVLAARGGRVSNCRLGARAALAAEALQWF